jgi:hypothetical protein
MEMTMRKTVLLATLAVTPLIAIGAFAGVGIAGNGQSELDTVRAATTAYHDVDVAEQVGGYTYELPEFNSTVTCIQNGNEGAMGIHMVNLGLVDGTIDPAHPEALLYEKRNDGSMKLIGVEFVAPWSEGSTPPTVAGQELKKTDVSRFFGPGAFLYTLHAWIWKPNPNGIFDPWNTRVSC